MSFQPKALVLPSGANNTSNASGRKPVRRNRLATFAWEPWALGMALLLAWQFIGGASSAEGNPLLPSPEIVFQALLSSLPELGRGTVSSLLILLPGYGTALLLGVSLGLLAGTTPRLARTFFPFAKVAAPIPPPYSFRMPSQCCRRFTCLPLLLCFLALSGPSFTTPLRVRWR